MASDGHCADVLVVGMTVWLPDDPRERFVDELDLMGCNRLFCGSCQSPVRHLDHVSFAGNTEPPTSDVARLYLDPHPETYAGFSRDQLPWRLYLCKCECAQIAGVKSTFMSDTFDSWRCAGHPAPSAPEAVEPPPPPNDAAVAALLRARLSEGWDFALRWRPPFLFRSVWPVVTELLVDPDPRIRARALELVDAWTLGTAKTFDRLLDLTDRYATLYTGALRTRLSAILTRRAIEFPAYSATIAEAVAKLG